MDNSQFMSSEKHSSRFKIMLVMLPLCVGIIVGDLVASGILLWAGLSSPPECAVIAATMTVGACLYVTVALGGMSLFPRVTSLVPRKWWVIALIGVAYPLTAIGSAGLAEVYSSEVPLLDLDMKFLLIAAVLIAAVIPFLLIEKSPGSSHIKMRTARWAIGLIACVFLYGAALVLGRRMQAARLERDCHAVVEWVKSEHAISGAYPKLALPLAMAHLAADGLVNGVVLPDGRVVLEFRTDIGWIGTWNGFVYCSGPMNANEVGLDRPDPWFVSNWGYPELRVAGLGDAGTCIVATMNPHEYLVGYRN